MSCTSLYVWVSQTKLLQWSLSKISVYRLLVVLITRPLYCVIFLTEFKRKTIFTKMFNEDCVSNKLHQTLFEIICNIDTRICKLRLVFCITGSVRVLFLLLLLSFSEPILVSGISYRNHFRFSDVLDGCSDKNKK